MNIDNVLDKEELLLRIDDDRELLQELIELFLEDYPEQVTQIEVAIRDHDAVKLRAAAHTLKGSVGNFCAKGAFEAAKRLELNGANSDFTDVQAGYDVLVQELRQVEQALNYLAAEENV